MKLVLAPMLPGNDRKGPIEIGNRAHERGETTATTKNDPQTSALIGVKDVRSKVIVYLAVSAKVMVDSIGVRSTRAPSQSGSRLRHNAARRHRLPDPSRVRQLLSNVHSSEGESGASPKR